LVLYCIIIMNIKGKAERTKQFIIEQSAPIFNSKGIAGTTIDDILAATKMAKGGIYGNFENKEAISIASVDFLFGKMSAKAYSVMSKEKTAVKKLWAFIDLRENPLVPFIEGGCPILNFGVDSDNTNPTVKRKVKAMIEGSMASFIEILKQGIVNGELSDKLNPEEYCLKVLIMLEGATLVSRVTDTVKPMHTVIKMLKAELKSFTNEKK
jgi:TetR/AcrR family transcriptional regulator, transcriptional repressor for nem operon